MTNVFRCSQQNKLKNNMMGTYVFKHNQFIVIIINPNNIIMITTVTVPISIYVYCMIWVENNHIFSSNNQKFSPIN
jgi:hypothetical protein